MILDGKSIRNIILDEVKLEVNKLTSKPKLVVIQVGNDIGSNVYIKQKRDMCLYVGYDFEHIRLDNDVDTDDLVNLINKLNIDDSVTGILIQLPLSNKINTSFVVNSISIFKDVDGLSEHNKKYNEDGLYACTSKGIMELLNRYNISVKDREIVIVGGTGFVGASVAVMMETAGGKVTICNSKTNNINKYTKNADILVVAVGKAKFITSDMVGTDSIIVDVGINRYNNELCGDVSFNDVKDKVRFITPVPGGVGPMTVAMLARNMMIAYKMQNKK